ncbi:MAG: NADH:flavin oxidoreductase [Acidimicrobiales bacterium]
MDLADSHDRIDPFKPARLGPLTLKNRFIKAATFEAMSVNNQVSEALIDFHLAVAAGGVAMTTLAYCAVARDGQGAPNEIVVDAEAASGLTEFTSAIHDAGTKAAIQLGHAGPVGASGGGKRLAPSKVFAAQAMKYTTAATAADIERVVGDHVLSAKIAVDAGFDCLELHFGHGYLVSSFLSPKLNKRNDDWGGSLANRSRLARSIATEVRAAVGSTVAITAKLNMADGVDGGIWLDESIETARLLAADGALDALELTGGSSFENPMYLFRGDVPIAEMAATMPRAVGIGFRLMAKKFMKAYPFEEAYFLPLARQFREAIDLSLILLGGINQLDTVQGAVDDGFEFVALGRALLREPNLINRWRDGRLQDSLCIHCNKCMPSIYQGTHCVLLPPESRPGYNTWVELRRTTKS